MIWGNMDNGTGMQLMRKTLGTCQARLLKSLKLQIETRGERQSCQIQLLVC